MTLTPMKQKPRRVKTKDSRPKVRKTWIRHPAEKVVGNKRRKPPTSRELTEDALEEYKEE